MKCHETFPTFSTCDPTSNTVVIFEIPKREQFLDKQICPQCKNWSTIMLQKSCLLQKFIEYFMKDAAVWILTHRCSSILPRRSTTRWCLSGIRLNYDVFLQNSSESCISQVNIVMFLLPGLLMTLCYSLIVAKLYCSAGSDLIWFCIYICIYVVSVFDPLICPFITYCAEMF